MPGLKHWQSKIQEKRKQTNFRDFLMEMASWKPYGFYKNNGHISRYADTPRTPTLVTSDVFEKHRDQAKTLTYDHQISFFTQL